MNSSSFRAPIDSKNILNYMSKQRPDDKSNNRHVIVEYSTHNCVFDNGGG